MAGYDSTVFSLVNNVIGPGSGVTFETELMYVPPRPYIPGTPAIPPTPAQIRYLKNKGWNTSARSVNPFLKDTYYNFTCSTGIEGCCIGIGNRTFTGHNLSQFQHAIICNTDGIEVFESGETVTILTNQQTSGIDIRVYRDDDETIHYVVTATVYVSIHGSLMPIGEETFVYKSLTANTIINPYIFGFIYSGGDKILTSSYNSGKVVYGSF